MPMLPIGRPPQHLHKHLPQASAPWVPEHLAGIFFQGGMHPTVVNWISLQDTEKLLGKRGCMADKHSAAAADLMERLKGLGKMATITDGVAGTSVAFYTSWWLVV